MEVWLIRHNYCKSSQNYFIEITWNHGEILQIIFSKIYQNYFVEITWDYAAILRHWSYSNYAVILWNYTK